MCGIVGYIGPKQAAPLLLEALEKLEYRGYDSAGLAILGGNGLSVCKAKGRLSVLFDRTEGGATMPGTAGIGHTRWATHGEPSDVNSHPHLSHSGRVAVVHNGIVENYAELREFLTEHGYEFQSDTDTEIVAQLVDFYYHGDPVKAVPGCGVAPQRLLCAWHRFCGTSGSAHCGAKGQPAYPRPRRRRKLYRLRYSGAFETYA